MTALAALRTSALVRVNEMTNRTLVLPVVIFHPTSRCNSRCVSCDWWRSSGADDLSLPEIDAFAAQLPAFDTRLVVLSGGEPLLHPDVFAIADLFRQRQCRLHLLTSGVLLERTAAEVGRRFERVIVSLDAHTEEGYHAIRGVRALAVVERGVARVRAATPALPITARATVHRHNFRLLPDLVEHARAMALDGISFLAADVSSLAFGRQQLDDRRLALSAAEIAEFQAVVEATIASHAADFDSGFIAESPDRLRRLPQYYAALAGHGRFPAVACNAPWMSVVVEADGGVRPCFFHDRVGSVREQSLATIVGGRLAAFRAALDVGRNATCQRCVCSLKTGFRSAPWN